MRKVALSQKVGARAVQLVQGVHFQGKDTACVNVGTRIVPLMNHLEHSFSAVWKRIP